MLAVVIVVFVVELVFHKIEHPPGPRTHEFSIKCVVTNNFDSNKGLMKAFHTLVLAVFGTRTQLMAQSNFGRVMMAVLML